MKRTRHCVAVFLATSVMLSVACGDRLSPPMSDDLPFDGSADQSDIDAASDDDALVDPGGDTHMPDEDGSRDVISDAGLVPDPEGDTDTSPDADGATVESELTILTAQCVYEAETLCASLYRCWSQGEGRRDELERSRGFSDEEECAVALETKGIACTKHRWSVEQGYSTLDESATRECIQGRVEESCEDFAARDLRSCLVGESGSRQLGESCATNGDCEDFAHACRVSYVDLPTSIVIPGECRPLGTSGEVCDEDRDCVVGLSCQLSGFELICEAAQ